MGAFIGRDRELAILERLYRKPGFQFPVLYGRRRVGKTYLMAQFARALPTIFFTAVEDNATINLRNLSREIYAYEHPDSDSSSAPVFRDFQTAFEAIFALAREQRIVFVIDEYPYLARADKSVSSILQALIDRNKDTSQLFIMLCGSSLSFMREQVLGEKSPLYGRRTAQIELAPFDFFDARRFFPDADPRDAACYYGMVGGVPLYLQQFDSGASLPENVERAFLSPDSILYEEPTNLLKQEVQKASLYNAVIGAIAAGKTENNEIATTVGVSSTELTYYLKELQRIGLVEREVPVVASGRRAAYRLTDNLFRFWYRFVAPNRSTIERHMPQRALRAVQQGLAGYMGAVFERICADWLWRCNAAGSLPVEFDQLGRWWGNDPVAKREEEIDVVCLDGKQPVVVGECKWQNRPVDASVVQTLAHRAALIGADANARYFVFAKEGFTDGCRELAASMGNTYLVPFDEMCRVVALPGPDMSPPEG